MYYKINGETQSESWRWHNDIDECRGSILIYKKMRSPHSLQDASEQRNVNVALTCTRSWVSLPVGDNLIILEQ